MKKLIPALAMLLISAVLVGSSTYAWFSMNEEVSATGMQISAKTDNTYLLIGTGDDDTAGEIQTAGSKDVSLEPNAVVYPASIDDDTGAATVSNWYIADALAPDAAAIDSATKESLDSYEGYVIKKTVYLTVAAGANDANGLSVTAAFTAVAGKDISAAKAIVVDGSTIVTLTSTDATADLATGNITDDAVRAIDIYFYYDGNEAAVNTNNSSDLDGATIDLAFNVNAIPAA